MTYLVLKSLPITSALRQYRITQLFLALSDLVYTLIDASLSYQFIYRHGLGLPNSVTTILSYKKTHPS
jgi:hypothetical protein